jgi:hypothetical protein
MLNQQKKGEAQEEGQPAELDEETKSIFTGDGNYIIYF